MERKKYVANVCYNNLINIILKLIKFENKIQIYLAKRIFLQLSKIFIRLDGEF